MDYLDYASAEDDLTVMIVSEDSSVCAEIAVNRVLLRMLSPWWTSRLTSSGFKEAVDNGRCTVVHDEPEIALLALRAARLGLSQETLQADADLNTIFKLWRLADMWQFAFLSNLCQRAMTSLLTQTDDTSLKEFVDSAMQHSDSILEEVLIPLLQEHPKLRSYELYLAFDNNIMFALAERVPIAGFQIRSSQFKERFAQYALTLDDEDFLRFMLYNHESRQQKTYAERSWECCILLFCQAPLPLVSSMVDLVMDSDWSSEQKSMAISSIDFDRLISADQESFCDNLKQLPDLSYMWLALWQARNRQFQFPYISISCSPPWVVAFGDEDYSYKKRDHSAGPVTISLTGRSQAIFVCTSPAYGIVRTEAQYTDEYFFKVVQSGVPFHVDSDIILIVFESPQAVVQTKDK